MQTEKQRERLVELLNAEISHLVLSDIDLVWTCERINYLADYLMSNNVVVLPENALVEVKPRIVYEDKEKAIVDEEYVITWKNKRTLLKEKEMSNGN